MIRGTRDRLFMATIGLDGLRLWRIEDRSVIATPPPQNLRGPTTAVQWLSHQDRNQRLLCLETALGYLVFWGQHPNHVGDMIQ